VKQHIIELHRRAPPKPAYGAPCNGCGVCCATTPCPVAMLFLWQFSGRCRALLWQDEASRYACGMALSPDRFASFIPARWRSGFARWFASRIAAGAGCDASIETDDAPG